MKETGSGFEWSETKMDTIAYTKGLQNSPGENNCFLNSAVQVLWHIDAFRENFNWLSCHACLGSSCIFCALKVIFVNFKYSEQTVLPPNVMRNALAKTFISQRKFQIGLMDDAAECFENILLRIHFHLTNTDTEDVCSSSHCITHQKFSMNVVEQVVCEVCETSSEPMPFAQTVYYVSTSALCKVKGHVFASSLRAAITDYRSCTNPRCNSQTEIQRNLINVPDVITLGFVWDSDRASAQHIYNVMTRIDTEICLKDLFHSVIQPAKRKLVGIVCYYGKHYLTFFFHSIKKTWISFDDANVQTVGNDWSCIISKCCQGHFQPLLLLYTNPDISPLISTKDALKCTIRLSGNNSEIIPSL